MCIRDRDQVAVDASGAVRFPGCEHPRDEPVVRAEAGQGQGGGETSYYPHLRTHETRLELKCLLLRQKKKSERD